MPLTPNTRLGPYEIVAPLGAGGMGEVYRAKDTRLDREVAVKVLPEQLARDPLALARFEREAKAVAALSHPNILAIYDVGSHNETAYVVTELLEGETLRQRLGRAAISWRQAVEIAVSVADGLAAAHVKGVIHRDLKPENLFITTAGHVKILDFGLARMEPEGQVAPGHAAESTPTITLATRPGAILGTLNYMSPEQVRGLRTDGRSDIFSLGCVVYEMIAGRRAFTGDTPADTMTAILKEEPAGITDARTGIRPELERVIARCLEKKPEQRFQSAPDLAFTLRSILADSGATPAAVPPRRAPPWYAKGGIVSLVAAALLVGAFMVRRELRLVRREARETIGSLAVLPLENVSRDPEQEYFVDGMTEALISDLAKIGGLKVISRTSVMRYKATTKSLPEIARELNVGAVVEGSVLRVGDRVRITAQLIQAATDQHLWAESYDRDLRDVLRLHSELARTIAQEIKVTLTPQEEARLAATRTVNPAAHDAYIRGRFEWKNRSPTGMQKAIEYFRRAIEIDPQYAPAYSGLADAHTALARLGHRSPREALPVAKQAALKAVEIDDRLAEAHGALAVIAFYLEWDWIAAERELRRALDLNPSYEEAHHEYSHLLQTLGRPDESLTEGRRALELNPLDPLFNVHLGWHYMMTRQFDQAITQLKSVLDMDPNHFQALLYLGQTYMYNSLHAEAIVKLEARTKLAPDNAQAMSALAAAYAAGGRGPDAKALLERLEGSLPQRYVSACDIAAVYAALGEIEVALDWLQKACEERAPRMVELGFDPAFDSLRSDPRFADLVRRVGLPPLSPTPSKTPLLPPLVRGETGVPPPLPRGDKGGLTAGKIMLAVLPFENLSRDPEQDYFSDGLTEEMISQLSRLNPKKLGVIARTSAMHYKNTAKTIDAIGRELGVAYIVEGSVRRAGERVRITAQLIQVSDQTHLWAENYERDLKDIFALQSDVAERIAGSLTVELLPGAVSTSARARTINPAAHEAYLKGRFFYWDKRTSDALRTSIKYFEEAARLDPNFALAYAGIADAYAQTFDLRDFPQPEARRIARAAANRALELDDTLAEAHSAHAHTAFWLEWDWPVAERAFLRAIELNPNYANAHHFYGHLLERTGRAENAAQEFERALELSPSSVQDLVCYANHLIYVGRYDDAEAALARAHEANPSYAYTHLARGFLHERRGDLEAAFAEYKQGAEASNGEPNYLAAVAYGHAILGRREEARKLLEELVEQSAHTFVRSMSIAQVHVGLGEIDEAFVWLEKAFENREHYLTELNVDPRWDPLRGDPRFDDLIRRMGLPPARR